MKLFIFLADGFEEIEAIAPADVFRRAGIDVVTVSVTGNLIVEGAHGIVVCADEDFTQMQAADFAGDALLYLPGGMPGTSNLDKSEKLKNLIMSAYTNKQVIAAICAAPLILGKMGLLRGKKAVCYPGYETFLEGAEIPADETIVQADNVLTAKAAGVAIPFALKIIEIVKCKDIADKVKADIFY
ncbi:MAG: DJ-1/PfpI family protein [Paludibacter sp.]|jgi:4-methyl-5(b-hydroxyethyl)-thiazole monophosphate biosynthesis|nr:DJ-1/PfpI family protein [Paludibacter sp.]